MPRASRRFFLAEAPSAEHARLAEGELDHARRVLRLRAGDELEGLDGDGGVWPLRVVRAEGRAFEVLVVGAPSIEPEPGDSGAELPWIEVAVSLPKAARAEELVDKLVQLGASAWIPLVCARTEGAARELTPERLTRLERAAREAVKQARRARVPLLREPQTPEHLAARRAAAVFVLAPEADATLLELARAIPRGVGTRERPIVLAIGPEGGWTDEERTILRDAGASEAALGPHVLRVETAAEAALGVLACALFRRR